MLGRAILGTKRLCLTELTWSWKLKTDVLDETGSEARIVISSKLYQVCAREDNDNRGRE